MSSTLELSPYIEIPFTMKRNTVSNAEKVTLVSKVAPFNSGTWIMYCYGYYPCTIGLEWSGVHSSIAVSSFSLVVNYAYQRTNSQVHQFSSTLDEDSKTAGKVESSFSYHSQPGYTYALKITWTTSPPRGTRRVIDFAQTYSAHLSTAFPNDIRIFFPSDGRSLWASRTVLSGASAYFKTAFESGFSEASVRSSEEIKTIGSASSTPPDLPAFKYSTITVTKASFRAYSCVLCWIYTSHIDFAPLPSTFAADARADGTSLLTTFLDKFASKNPKLPLPCSPKEIYRLAHYLELAELESLALQNLGSQLTPDNIAVELFSETSGRYEKVLEVMIEYAVAHTKEMKASAGWKATMARIGELEWAATVLAGLMDKIM